MKSLSGSEYRELISLYESIYAPKFESILDEFTDEDLLDLTDEYIEQQVEEFFLECLEGFFEERTGQCGQGLSVALDFALRIWLIAQ